MEQKFNLIQNTLEKLVRETSSNQMYKLCLRAIKDIELSYYENKKKERKERKDGHFKHFKVGAKKIRTEFDHIPTDPGCF